MYRAIDYFGVFACTIIDFDLDGELCIEWLENVTTSNFNYCHEQQLLAHLQSSVFKLSKDLIDSIHEEGIVAYTS